VNGTPAGFRVYEPVSTPARRRLFLALVVALLAIENRGIEDEGR
jgi:hypothetical protein